MSKILTDDLIPSLKAKTEIQDSGWQPLTMGTGWDPNWLCYARKLTFPGGGAIVYLRGLAKPTANATLQVGTIPVGFRPSWVTPVLGLINGSVSGEVARLSIQPTGGINIYSVNTSWDWVNLGCSYFIN